MNDDQTDPPPSPLDDPGYWGLDMPFDSPADRDDYQTRCWVEYNRQLSRWQSDRDAELGRELVERDNAELDALHVSHAVSALMTDVPRRAGRRAHAHAVLVWLRTNGHSVTMTHGAICVTPPPPARLAPVVADLDPEIGDALDDGY